MHIGTFDNFTECYVELLKKVMNEPQYESAPRDQNIREILGASFTIKNAKDRIPYVPKRKFSMSYMVAELVWYLSGNNSTEWISNYSSFWKNISDDGVTANSAYGSRLFRKNEKIAQGRFTQVEYVINELRRDSDSRRAVMHLRVPDDSVDASLDVPCTLALQFFIRDGSLHQVVNMRSSDLVFGIAYDVPAFTIFQEMIANELGVKVGSYTHVSNSLHIYERHFDMVNEVIERENVDKAIDLHRRNGQMPDLPGGLAECFESVERLCKFEEKLQRCASPGDIELTLTRWFPVDMKHVIPLSDWAIILAAARLRKLKFKNQASQLTARTSFSGYHFNQRTVG